MNRQVEAWITLKLTAEFEEETLDDGDESYIHQQIIDSLQEELSNNIRCSVGIFDADYEIEEVLIDGNTAHY